MSQEHTSFVVHLTQSSDQRTSEVVIADTPSFFAVFVHDYKQCLHLSPRKPFSRGEALVGSVCMFDDNSFHLLTAFSSRIFSPERHLQDQGSATKLPKNRSIILFITTNPAACHRESALKWTTLEV